MSRTEVFKQEWNGFYINNCLPLDHPLRNAVEENPRNINWDEDLMSSLEHVPVIYKFLRIGKLYYLAHDIESEELDFGTFPLLEDKLLIDVKTHSYGIFKGLTPQKRVSTMRGVYREQEGSSSILKSYLSLPNSLTTKSKINKVPIGRRTDAIDFVEARAVEIDTIMPGVFNLEDRIQDFFRDNLNAMTLYEKTGATDIFDSIQAILNKGENHWLKVPIPVAMSDDGKPIFKVTGEEIIRIFTEAIAPICSLEINTFWSLFESNNFILPTVEEVAIAVAQKLETELNDAITALDISNEFKEFKAKYLSNGININGIKAIAPQATEPNENWIFTQVPDSDEIIADLSDEQKSAIALHPEAELLSFKELVLLELISKR